MCSKPMLLFCSFAYPGPWLHMLAAVGSILLQGEIYFAAIYSRCPVGLLFSEVLFISLVLFRLVQCYSDLEFSCLSLFYS